MNKNIIKKFMVIVLALMTLGLVACQKEDKVETKEPEKTDVETTDIQDETEGLTTPVHLTFATQDVGTGAYQYASAISAAFVEVLPEGSNLDLTTESPGGVGAPIIVNNNQADIIMSNAGPAKWSAETGILDNPPTEDARAIAGGLGRDFLNVLFTKEFVDKTGISSVEELVEQEYPVRIAVKKVGSLGNLAFVKLFETYGVTADDIKAWGGEVNFMDGDAIKSYLQDGKADMTVDHVAAGQANTTELCMTTEMYFPQLSDETLTKLGQEGFSTITIEPDTWKGQTEPIKSVGSQQVILVNKDMEDEVAYTLTKALVEKKDEIAAQIAALEYFKPEDSWKPEMLGAEIHPGAAQYYKDAGYMD